MYAGKGPEPSKEEVIKKLVKLFSNFTSFATRNQQHLIAQFDPFLERIQETTDMDIKSEPKQQQMHETNMIELREDNLKQKLSAFIEEKCVKESVSDSKAKFRMGLKSLYYIDAVTFFSLLEMPDSAKQMQFNFDLELLVQIIFSTRKLLEVNIVKKALLKYLLSVISYYLKKHPDRFEKLESNSRIQDQQQMKKEWDTLMSITRAVIGLLQKDSDMNYSFLSQQREGPESPKADKRDCNGAKDNGFVRFCDVIDLVSIVEFCGLMFNQYFNNLTLGATPGEKQLYSILRMSELVVSCSNKESLIEYENEREKCAWQSLFAYLLKVFNLPVHYNQILRPIANELIINKQQMLRFKV